MFQATKTALDYMYVSHIPLIIITDVRHINVITKIIKILLL